MGIIRRNTMALLSLLAALVIIVHTEDLSTEYRRGLRPRTMELGSSRQEQSWRAVELEPMQQSKQTWDDDNPEEQHKPLRPVRKRRRRLQSLPGEVPIKPYLEETSRQYIELDLTGFQTTDTPKRRRKNSASVSNQWMDVPFAADRPMRRHGLRKKRPSLDTWPRLSEFVFHPEDTARKEVNIQTGYQQSEPNFDDRPVEHFVRKDYDDDDELIEMGPETTTTDCVPIDGDGSWLTEGGDESYTSYSNSDKKHDKSLSEFSIELSNPPAPPRETVETIQKRDKGKEKTLGTLNEKSKAQGDSGIDAQTLKEILKRSNGTSLSEILQQHNLSLADLLNGRENAVSALNAKNSFENKHIPISNKDDYEKRYIGIDVNEDTIDTEKNCTTEVVSENTTTKSIFDSQNDNDNETAITVVPVLVNNERTKESSTPNNNDNNGFPRLVAKRRFPGTIRKKQRMRPSINSTVKVNLNRQVLPLNARNLYPSRRNVTKLKEWNEIVVTIVNNVTHDEIKDKNETEIVPVFVSPDEIILPGDRDKNITATPDPTNTNSNITEDDNSNLSATEIPFATTIKEFENQISRFQEVHPPTAKPAINASTLRRQSYNNRLKKKRLKQKNSTTESPQDDLMESLIGMGNLVSSSEFIARTQTTKSHAEDTQTEITLEDFMPKETSGKLENRLKSITMLGRSSTTPIVADIQITTEEASKLEIEEILNDTQSSAKLSRILMERNMTLRELLEHRQRGSSYVHLADIFHNASKEPNPPEPFLSKSFIEPISKETYPLRAILDANSHEPTAKAKTIDTNVVEGSFVNIPVVMNFGNNVNENAENMGIMSLFNNITSKGIKGNNHTLNQDSEGSVYKISITNENIKDTIKANNTVRESRVLHHHKDDIVNWKEIFSLMQSKHNNNTEQVQERTHSKTDKKNTLEEDVDGDGLIDLEDLQRLNDFDRKIGLLSDEEMISQHKIDTQPHSPGNPEKLPYNTISVTVVTASIAGLAMILFLLTYAAFKWKQQRVMNSKKHSFCDERIPTPVFENRKGHKNNCSTRSISPMLSSSNIYTLNTLDSRNGDESPDYMWDSLRKPFQ